MDIAINPEISLLDQIKIQAQVLLPVLRALRAEFGKPRADALVASALREWTRDMVLRMGALMTGSPREKWAGLTAATLPRIGSDIDLQMLRQEPDAMEFNVTGCRYADFFRALGEPELGSILLCATDDYTAEVGRPEVEFTRTQTIMQGAKYCDFRYRMKAGGTQKRDED